MTLFILLTILFIVISVTMVLVILAQRPQGGGLSGAFGGAGGGGADTVFGGRVGDALTWGTSIIFVVFMLIAIGLNWVDQEPPARTPGAGGTTGAATASEGEDATQDAGADEETADDPAEDAQDQQNAGGGGELFEGGVLGQSLGDVLDGVVDHILERLVGGAASRFLPHHHRHDHQQDQPLRRFRCAAEGFGTAEDGRTRGGG